LPEYKETYVEGTSQTIPYELILKHRGSERHFEGGRLVVSQQMAAHMLSPFQSSEAEL
jgi:hypothetical protein